METELDYSAVPSDENQIHITCKSHGLILELPSSKFYTPDRSKYLKFENNSMSVYFISAFNKSRHLIITTGLPSTVEKLKIFLDKYMKIE